MMKKITLAFVAIFFCQLTAFAQFAVNGDAIQLDENCYQLTPALNTQAGSIWFLDKINLEEDFVLQFDIFLGSVDANGADGIYFAMQPISTSLGGGGGGIGFDGISPAIGVEFDTWQNGDKADPTFDHMAIMTNGIVDHSTPNNLDGPIQTSATAANVEDGEFHNVKISWDAEAQFFAAYFDCELRVSYSGDMVNEIFAGDPEVFWGFTSATGGANNIHSVCFDFISFTELPDTTICAGESVQLSVPDNFIGYSWSPNEGLDDPYSPAPIATPNVTTTYMVTILDECLDEFHDEITITVDEFAAIDLGNDTTICSGGSLVLDGTPIGGGSPDFVYTWQDGSQEMTFEVTENGMYWVTVADGECVVSDTINVLLGMPEVNAGDDVSICMGDVTQLNAVADAGFTFAWLPTDGLTAADIANPMAMPTETTTYTVTVTDEIGCTASDEVTVNVTALSNPGEMPQAEVYACAGDAVSATSVGVELADGNVLVYVLHNSPTADLGTILASNISGTFSKDDSPSIATNTPYYISVVAGVEGAVAGFPDLEHPCTVSNAGTPVVFLKQIVIDTDDSCDETTYELSVVFNIRGGLPEFDASEEYTITGSYLGSLAFGQNDQIGPFPGGESYSLNAVDALGCAADPVGVDSVDCKNTPIELLYFSGKAVETGNLLQWETAVEIGNDFFTLLRSVDGIQFEAIGRVAGAGDSFTAIAYNFLDKNAPFGKSYYQLMQTDFDGQTSRSNVISLFRATENTFAITPTVLNDGLQIAYTSPVEQAMQFTIYDVKGRTLVSKSLNLNMGAGYVELPIAGFSTGLYILSAANGQEAVQVKFLKTQH